MYSYGYALNRAIICMDIILKQLNGYDYDSSKDFIEEIIQCKKIIQDHERDRLLRQTD